MNKNLIAGPNNARIRAWFRRLGPVVLALGVISGICGILMIVIGVGAFVLFDMPQPGTPGFGQTPWGFKCAFLGMLSVVFTIPLLFVGSTLTQLGFLQDIQRYMAGESAPVAKEAINYLGEAAQPGIKAAAKAITEGILEAQEQPPIS